MSEYVEIQRTDRAGLSRVTINNNFQSLESLIVDKIQGLDWQNSVLTFIDEASAVETPGNRYIADSNGDTWTKDYIYEWALPVGPSSSVSYEWVEYEPNEGFACLVEDENTIYIYNGVSWVKLVTIIVHNDLNGLQGGNASQRYHLENSEHSTLTGGLEASALHYHDLEVSVPATNTSPGLKGQWALDTNYYYHCVATNTWVRKAVETVFEAETSSSSSP